MRDIYTTLLLIFALLILICSYVIGKRDRTPLTKAIRYIMIAAPCTMAAYAGALVMPSKSSAEWMYALYYTVSDILLLCMLSYALQYTRVYIWKPIQKALLGLVVAVDGLLMILNVCTEDIFIFRCGLVDGDGTRFYDIAERGGLYNVHRFVIYGLVALVVIPLVVKIVKSPAMYRGKYWLTLLSLLVIIAANVAYLIMELEIDYSVLAYGIMAVAIYYFNVMYIPQGLVEGLLTSSIKSMDDGVICYDVEGNCIYANSIAYGFFRAEDMASFVEYYQKWMDGRTLSEVEDASWKEEHEVYSARRYYDVQFKRL